ncbi:hypothetical protein [Pajaroellobacter abortibovis]|uniref:Protein BatD n=1 Tax=Pajaroellobacter abortibovis TaxID=1882918 RepID=A0A1L6MW39_9BACT|nr:hypothetical protein [Pajaroellobacter abortibovis]APR99736.1 hypothetical protein BCY86_02890 [Pajaroellobacter abortibovis]
MNSVLKKAFWLTSCSFGVSILSPHEVKGEAAAEVETLCVEQIPTGMQRPTVESHFPERGINGYRAVLQVDVEHGKGESIFPSGFQVENSGKEVEALKKAGFFFPVQTGKENLIQKKTIEQKENERVHTQLEIPFLVLAPKSGRNTLVLPSLPIAIARANGELATLCTHSHSFVVEDSIDSTPEAKPQANVPPRQQREEWIALKQAVICISAGVVLGILVAYGIRLWRRRPVPLPPPSPPWEEALETLGQIRTAGLLEANRLSEYFDRIHDTIRLYLGARYGFDGLESTTDEIAVVLRSIVASESKVFPQVISFLQECDLVKFANLTPPLDACNRALAMGEWIVQATRPSSSNIPPLPSAHEEER